MTDICSKFTLLFDGNILLPECDYTKGVYMWHNVINDKMYIGQAGGVDGLSRRLSDEIYAFKQNTHKGTPLLSQGVRKYGLNNFRVYLLCRSDDVDELSNYEKCLIKTFKTVSPNGYNITAGGKGTAGFSPTEETLNKKRGKPNIQVAVSKSNKYKMLDPNDRIVNITNMEAFCRERNLNPSHMINVFKGKDGYVSHKGWRRAEETRQQYSDRLSKTAYFVSPDNMLIKATNIKQFAIKNGLNQAAMNRVSLGHAKIHKGWRAATMEEIECGRTAGTDAPVTLVALGLSTGQYVKATGTIGRTNANNFSLVSSLERNFSNPA